MSSEEVYRVHGYSGLWRRVRGGRDHVRLKPVEGGASIKVPVKDVTPAGQVREQPITVLSGFHLLKDHWTDLRGLATYCDALVNNLSEAVAATRLKSRRRTRRQGFRTSLRYAAPRPDHIPERQLEWDLFTAFRPDARPRLECDGLWDHLITFQLPLYDDAAKDSWGHCDLLGIGRDRIPIVVELKHDDAKDSPLRSLLEAAGYAIAIQRVWPTVRDELGETFAELGISIDLGQSVSEAIQILVLAPETHWNFVRSQMTAEDTRALESLFVALREHRLEVLLGQILRNSSDRFDVQRLRLSSGEA